MQIYDMHVHCRNRPVDPHGLIHAMEDAGVYGGCVFSNWPKESTEYEGEGTSFEARMAEVKGWTEPYPDRLFPVLWIHPYEDDIFDKIDRAVEQGICAFKIICTNFYIHEDRCLQVLQRIADHKKPVFFHSGILWTGAPSSKYNRPVFWEALLDVKGLRFSMGHCSWPWTDECIALYGQFCYAARLRETSEMFLDLTPGAPSVYRKDLLTKLFKVEFGFPTDDSILFGTDCSAHHYNPDYAKKNLTLNNGILDELGIGEEVRRKIYRDNLMRFLGKDERKLYEISYTPCKREKNMVY